MGAVAIPTGAPRTSLLIAIQTTAEGDVATGVLTTTIQWHRSQQWR